MALTPADFANIEELKIRVMTLAWWVDNGFTDMSIDITWTYNQDMLIDTLDYFGLDSTSTGITDIMTVLNATTEEQAYYLLRAMFNYATYFINVREFADIQAWFTNIDQFGLTEPEAIDLIFFMLQNAIDNDVNGLSPDQEYYLDVIDDYTYELADNMADLANLESEVQDYIATLPEEIKTEILSFWQAQQFALDEYYTYVFYLNSIEDEFDYNEIDTIIEALDALYDLDPTNPEDLADINYYQTQYDSVYDLLPLEKQELIGILVTLHTNQRDAWEDRSLLEFSIFENQDLYDIVDALEEYHYTYEDSIYNLIYLEFALEQFSAQVTETLALIEAKNQEVLDHIANIDFNKRSDITAYWEAEKVRIQTENEYYYYYYKLYDLLDYMDADTIYNATYNIYYTDPTDTIAIDSYNAEIAAIYDNLSLELQALVVNFRASYNAYHDADNAAWDLYFDMSEHETIDFTIELDQMDYFSSDYGTLYSDLYVYYQSIEETEADLAVETANIEDVNQSVSDYIATLSEELQPEVTALWTSMTLASIANADLDAFIDNLYNYVSGSDIWNLYNVFAELYYLDPFDPDELDDYNYSLNLYNTIYANYSSEIQLLINDFETLRLDSIIAYEALGDHVDSFLNVEMLDSIYYILNDYEWEYEGIKYQIFWFEEQIDYYTYLYDNYVYDNYGAIALDDLMVNNPDLVKALMQIMLDDAQNLFANMPADSFDEIFDLVRFIMLPHGSFDEFTPEDILALTQDLSSMMKLMGATLDGTDEATIALALQTYLGYLADAMEMTTTEKTEFVTQMTALIVKYMGYAEITVDQFTLILDSLTIEEINMMVKFAHDAYSGRLTEFEMVVFGAGMINNILNIPGFDLDQLTDIYFEVYMDMNYEFTYDALDLQEIQDTFSAFMVDTKALIATVAMIDVTNMDTDDIANIMELMNRMESMAWYLEYPDPTALAAYDFIYSSDQFLDLVMMIFNATESEAPSVVSEIVALLGMSEEEAYYQVIGVMMVLRNLENVRSVSDILSVYRGLRSVGLTNAEIAEYGMTIFMGMAYPNMMDSSNVGYYEDEIALLNQEIIDLEASIAAKHAQVLAEIESVTDPTLKAYLLQVWGYSDVIFPADMDSYALIAAFQREYYLDWYLYNEELRPVYISGVQADIDEVYWMYGLYEEEIAFYEAIFAYEQANMALHQQFLNAASMISDFYYRDLIMNTHNQMVQLYINIAGVNLDIEWYNMRLAEAENDLLMLTAIYNFLGDPVNQALVEDVLVILLDEVEAMSMDPNVKALDMLMKFMQNPDIRYLDMNMMVHEMQSLSTLMANMGSTIDLADTAVIAQLLNAFIIEYVDVLEITDPLQEAALLADLQAMAVLYLPKVLAMPDVISAFLASMDEAKINQIMLIMREHDWIRWYHENSELKHAIVDAKLIMAIAGDDSLEYEAVIELIYGIYFDMNDMQGNTLPMTVTDMIAEMDDLMLQAELLVDIGLFGITIDNADDVTLFMTMLDSMFNWEEDPVI
jgi:hypothetical protein